MTNPTKMSLKNLMEFLSTPDGTSQNLDQNSQPGGAVHWNNLTGVPEIIKKVTDGETSLLINWRGELASAPVPVEINDAYRNTTTKTSYLYTQTGWVVLAKDGTDGAPGLPGEDGDVGISGTTPTIGVGSVTTGLPGTSASVTSTPTATGANFNFTIPRGADGAQGPAGANGVSIVWKGEYSSHPSSPVENWAYRNTADKKSYIYASGAWQTMCIDGAALPSGAPTAAPVISSPLAWSIAASTPVTYLITAYNSPTSFTATGLPLGLAINQSSGLISGSTSLPGEYSITISATNVIGTSIETLNLSVSGGALLTFFSSESTSPISTDVSETVSVSNVIDSPFETLLQSPQLRSNNNTQLITAIFSQEYSTINPANSRHEFGITYRDAMPALFTPMSTYPSTEVFMGTLYLGTTTLSSISTFSVSSLISSGDSVLTLPGFTGMLINFMPYAPGSSLSYWVYIRIKNYVNSVYQGDYRGYPASEAVISVADSASIITARISNRISYNGYNMICEHSALTNNRSGGYSYMSNMEGISLPLPASYFSENRRMVAGIAGPSESLDLLSLNTFQIRDIR